VSVSADLPIGSELLDYRIEGVLGRGGMSVVYRAYDPRLKRHVALKLMAPELAGDERFRERFLRESELAASLEHPNVVPIHDVGEVDGQLFIVMRLVEGGDLKTLLRGEGKLEPVQVIAIVSQIADALDAAHSNGLVHRDVKPSNALLDERRHVYLADFGLTRRITDPDPLVEGATHSMGTIDYVAPEQIRGDEVDGRADIYSLGCLLYECLTGEPPFTGSSDVAVLFAHLEEKPPSDAGLGDVMTKALAKDPDDRYQTCRELVAAARDALGISEPRRARWPFVVAGVGAAMLGAALLVVVRGQGGSENVPMAVGSAIAAIDPSSDRVVAATPVSGRPKGIAFGFGSLWVANLDDRTVMRVDPATRTVTRTLPVEDLPNGIAASRNAVWVVGSNPTRPSVTVRRIDPQFDVVAHETRIANVVRGSPGLVAAKRDVVWVAPFTGLLSRLDPRTSRVVQRFDPNAGPTGVVVTTDDIWISDSLADTVTRIDPTGRLTPIAVGHGPSGIAVGADAVWVADSLDNTVVRIDPRTRRVTATIPVGRAPIGIAVGAHSVWVANSQDGTVTRIDPAANTVAKTIEVGGRPQEIVVADGRVWVTVQPTVVGGIEAVSAGGTARLNATGDGFSEGLSPAAWQIDYATCARLVNYPDKRAPVGSRLVPEVAESLPTPSAHGNMYTFTIRKGFRFSPPSNEPVTARTFKYAIERNLSPKMSGGDAGNLGGVVGAQAYASGKAHSIAGVTARGNKLTIRLVAPTPDLLSRLEQTSCVVPLDTPPDPNLRAIPSAGPYYVASEAPGQAIVLERNPNYTGSRPHRLERIELTLGVSREKTVAQIESGAVDYAADGVPRSDARDLDAQYGPGSPAAKRGSQQYFLDSVPALDFLVLNMHRQLFRDVSLRKAVNYAIDRRALVRIGSPFTQRGSKPTDQYLPPEMPGFRDVRIYPDTPNLAAARRLAGGKKRVAVLYTCNDSNCKRIAQVVKANLKAIGIDVEVKTFTALELFQRLGRSGEYDLGVIGWIADYLDPYDFLNALLEGPFFPTFDDPTYKRKLAAAARLSGPRRYLAYAKLDADLARNAAPWVAFGNSVDHDFFSTRMGCQVYQPIYGVDLAALCIKKS
jgi:YVTN family beta-propeller protein